MPILPLCSMRDAMSSCIPMVNTLEIIYVLQFLVTILITWFKNLFGAKGQCNTLSNDICTGMIRDYTTMTADSTADPPLGNKTTSAKEHHKHPSVFSSTLCMEAPPLGHQLFLLLSKRLINLACVELP